MVIIVVANAWGSNSSRYVDSVIIIYYYEFSMVFTPLKVGPLIYCNICPRY